MSQPPPVPRDEGDRYVVLLRHRMRIDGIVHPAGTRLTIPHDKLRVAAWLCANGAARPLDARTARDVELHRALDVALPRPAAGPRI